MIYVCYTHCILLCHVLLWRLSVDIYNYPFVSCYCISEPSFLSYQWFSFFIIPVLDMFFILSCLHMKVFSYNSYWSFFLCRQKDSVVEVPFLDILQSHYRIVMVQIVLTYYYITWCVYIYIYVYNTVHHVSWNYQLSGWYQTWSLKESRIFFLRV